MDARGLRDEGGPPAGGEFEDLCIVLVGVVVSKVSKGLVAGRPQAGGVGAFWDGGTTGTTDARTDFEPEEEEVRLLVPAQEVEEVGHPGGVWRLWWVVSVYEI